MFEFLVLAVAGGFTTYVPPSRVPPRVEAVIQRGILSELVIKCASGTAVISYSEGDGKYCINLQDCSRDGETMIFKACGEPLK